MASIAHLPQELLENIANNLYCQRDLLSLVQSTKPVFSKLHGALFSDLLVSPQPTTLVGNPSILESDLYWNKDVRTCRFVRVHHVSHLRKLLLERPNLRRCVKTATIILPEVCLSTVCESRPTSDEIAQLVGTILQTNGARLPILHLVGTGSDWPYDAFARSYELRSSGTTPLLQSLSIEQLYRCFALPKIDQLVIHRHSTNVGHLRDKARRGTSLVKRLTLDFNVESMDITCLEHLLSWPSALEEFSCRGSQDFWSNSAVEGSVPALIELLQPQHPTLRVLCFLPGPRPQQRFYRNSRRLAHGLDGFTRLEELYIPLEHLQHFPSDQGFEGGSNSPGPCKMPPNLRFLHMTVHLRLGRDCPDPDDMQEKASAIIQLANQCSRLNEIRLDMVYPGEIKYTWGPELLRRRAGELLAVRSELQKHQVRLVSNIVLQESGLRCRYESDGENWCQARQWLHGMRKEYTEHVLSAND